MEIKAKCRFDKESAKAVAYVSAYKKSNPKKMAFGRIALFAVLLLVIIAELIIFGFRPMLATLIAVNLFIIGLDLFMYFNLPKTQYKSFGEMKEAENDYSFGYNAVKIQTKGKNLTAEAEIEYTMLTKVYETSRYFFLFLPGNRVYFVDKATMKGNDAFAIRNKLQSVLKKKYLLCNY